jgi:hypothetical protein
MRRRFLEPLCDSAADRFSDEGAELGLGKLGGVCLLAACSAWR